MSVDAAPRREPAASPQPRLRWPWLGLLAGIVLLVLALVLPGKTTAVATVDGTTISYASFHRWLVSAAASDHADDAAAPAQPPVPPDYTGCIASEKATAAKQSGAAVPSEATLKETCQAYNVELTDTVMGFLVSGQWFLKEGQREGVIATPTQVKAAMKVSFPSGSGLGAFLNRSHLSRADLMQEAEIYVVSAALRARHAGPTPSISSTQIAAYYEKYHSAIGNATLAQATPEIRALLVAQAQAPAVNAYLSKVQGRYRPLTACAPGYRVATYCHAT